MSAEDENIEIGSQNWTQNFTRYKLEEANYFLQETAKAYRIYFEDSSSVNRNIFLYDLSAFLSAARSITYYMQKQYSADEQFLDWYCPMQIAMKKDAELKFLVKARVEFIHFKPIIFVTRRAASLDATMRLVYSDGDPRKETAPPLPTHIPESESAKTKVKTIDVIFLPEMGLEKETPVMPFCYQQYLKLKGLVDQCEKRFCRIPHDQCDERKIE